MTDLRDSNRRHLLAAVPAACGLVLFGRAAAAPAEPDGSGPLFGAVAVDATPVADHGGAVLASALAQALLPQMRRVFADRLTPGRRGAPVLTARITAIYFADYVGGAGIDRFGRNDSIEGDGLVRDGRGQVSSTTHILTELSPTYSGAYYTAGIDRIRLDSLAYQFAYWLRREMNV